MAEFTLTLEEAIKQYEQFVNIYENHNLIESQESQKVIEQLTAELGELQEFKKTDSYNGYAKEFDKKYLLVIKQLVTWLKELQERRKQPTSSNMIDRQQAIDAVRNSYDEILDFTSTGRTIADSVEDILSELPPAQPERKKGEWIPHKSVFGGLGEKVYTCNQCGYNIGFHAENYCSNCGADMRGERDEID